MVFYDSCFPNIGWISRIHQCPNLDFACTLLFCGKNGYRNYGEKMSDLKTMKVLNVRTHVGGLHGKTSYDAKKDNADMELTPLGVLVKHKGTNVLIPWPNATEVILGDEGTAGWNTEPEKRGPGRPPGPKVA